METITLPDDVAERLNAFATAHGVDLAHAVAALLESKPPPDPSARRLAETLRGKIGVVDSRTLDADDRVTH